MYAAAGPHTSAIEAVRARVDPLQHSLIPVHVTLCRDHEMDDLAALRASLSALRHPPLVLAFDRPRPFSTHGVLLPCSEGESAFHRLRELVLGTQDIATLHPHITLAHPRNPPFAGDVLAAANALPEPLQLAFRRIDLIEQTGTGPWRVLESFALN